MLHVTQSYENVLLTVRYARDAANAINRFGRVDMRLDLAANAINATSTNGATEKK